MLALLAPVSLSPPFASAQRGPPRAAPACSNVSLFVNASLVDASVSPPSTIVTLMSLGPYGLFSGDGDFEGSFAPVDFLAGPPPDLYNLQQAACTGNVKLQGKRSLRHVQPGMVPPLASPARESAGRRAQRWPHAAPPARPRSRHARRVGADHADVRQPRQEQDMRGGRRAPLSAPDPPAEPPAATSPRPFVAAAGPPQAPPPPRQAPAASGH